MNYLFSEHSVLCRIIRITESYWKYIFEVKHPESFKNIGFEESIEFVRRALGKPDLVVRERIDPSIHLYYKTYSGK